MKITKYILSIIAANLVISMASSCEKENTPSPEDDRNITFQVKSSAELATKSESPLNTTIAKYGLSDDLTLLISQTDELISDIPLETKSYALTDPMIDFQLDGYGGFFIDAYSPSIGKFIDHEFAGNHGPGGFSLLKENGECYKYPIDGQDVTFWAYAPLFDEQNNNYNIIDCDNENSTLTFTYDASKTSQEECLTCDLIFGHNVQNSGTVNVYFEHALSAVTVIPGDMLGYALVSAYFSGVYNTGTCVYMPEAEPEDDDDAANAHFAWTLDENDFDPDFTFGADVDELGKTWPFSNKFSEKTYHFMIPQRTNESTMLHVSILNLETNTIIQKSISLSNVTWKAGHRYSYRISFNGPAVSATLLSGTEFYAKIEEMNNEYLAANGSSMDIRKVVFKTNSPIEDYTSSNVTYTKVQSSDSYGDAYAIFNSEDNILTITTESPVLYANTDCSSMFSGETNIFSTLESVDWGTLTTVKIENCESMFNGCSSLKAINMSKLTLTKVKSFKNLCKDCSALESADFSGLNLRNANDFYGMFYKCSLLTDVNLSNTTIGASSDWSYMFYYCRALPGVDFSQINVNAVRTMEHTFEHCDSFTEFDFDYTKFNTENVVNFNSMFHSCKGLKTVHFENSKTANALIIADMLSMCDVLEEVTSFIQSKKVKNASYLFQNCYKLKSVDMSLFTARLTDADHMFYGCNDIKEIDLSNVSIYPKQSIYGICGNCHNLEVVKFSKDFIVQCTNLRYMLGNASTKADSLTIYCSDADWNALYNFTEASNDDGPIYGYRTKMESGKWIHVNPYE